MGKTVIGVVGCGMISEIYMKNCTERFGNLKIAACADINIEAARKRSEQFNCRVESIDELLQDPEISVVLNLTPPVSHFDISMRALKAGKHVYTEKPMCINLEEGRALLDYARANNLYIGNAPDCFLGGGQQTCRELIENEEIGTPYAAQAFMFSAGPEYFHPNPFFFYQEGAGPLLDWGPYYISALVALMGSVKKVIGLGSIPVPIRTVLSEKSLKFGEKFKVEVPTYVSSLLEFENGFKATLNISFDMHYPYWESKMPFIRILGTKGQLDIPDVNKYEGPIIIRDSKGIEREVQAKGNFIENCRGMGLSDMAHAIQTGSIFRANGEFGFHVSEVLIAIQKSIESGTFIEIKSHCDKPSALSLDLPAMMYQD